MSRHVCCRFVAVFATMSPYVGSLWHSFAFSYSTLVRATLQIVIDGNSNNRVKEIQIIIIRMDERKAKVFS